MKKEQFIQDTGLGWNDLDLNYDDVTEMFGSGKLQKKRASWG